MIGRVWRLQRSYSDYDVSTDENELVTQWGMTRDEVRNFVSGRKTFTTVVLGDASDPFALFYADSELENAFMLEDNAAKEKLHEEILKGCKDKGLTRSLAEISKQIRNRKLKIKIYG